MLEIKDKVGQADKVGAHEWAFRESISKKKVSTHPSDVHLPRLRKPWLHYMRTCGQTVCDATVLIPRLWSYFGHHNGQLAKVLESQN